MPKAILYSLFVIAAGCSSAAPAPKAAPERYLEVPTAGPVATADSKAKDPKANDPKAKETPAPAAKPKPAPDAKAAKDAKAKPQPEKAATHAPKPAPKPWQPGPLDAAAIEQGWISLFDGTLAGWSGDPAFEARDGILEGKPGALRLDSPLGDFRLRLEVAAEGGESAGAVVLRANRKGEGKTIALKLKPGQWHTLEASAYGSRFSARLDGKTLFESRQFGLAPGAPLLRVESGHLRFRHIQARPTDLACLFNGKDLTGWRVLPKGEWTVKEGILEGTGGPLETAGAFDDFVLQLDGKGGTVYYRAEKGTPEAGYPVTFAKPAERPWTTVTLIASGRHFAWWSDGKLVKSWEDKNPLGLDVRDRMARLFRGTLALAPGTYANLCLGAWPRR